MNFIPRGLSLPARVRLSPPTPRFQSIPTRLDAFRLLRLTRFDFKTSNQAEGGSWASPDLTKAPRRLEIVFGGGRASYGDADETFPGLGQITAMEQTCAYCYKLALLVGEVGIEYTPHIANISLGAS